MLDLLADGHMTGAMLGVGGGGIGTGYLIATLVNRRKNGGLSHIERSVIKMVTTLDFMLGELKEIRRQRE